MMTLLELLPLAAIIAVIVCLPLLADEMPGTAQNHEQTAARKSASRLQRGATVPYISMNTQHRDQ